MTPDIGLANWFRERALRTPERKALHFEGRLTRHKRLKPGRYAILINASVAGKHSVTRVLHFTVAAG